MNVGPIINITNLFLSNIGKDDKTSDAKSTRTTVAYAPSPASPPPATAPAPLFTNKPFAAYKKRVKAKITKVKNRKAHLEGIKKRAKEKVDRQRNWRSKRRLRKKYNYIRKDRNSDIGGSNILHWILARSLGIRRSLGALTHAIGLINIGRNLNRWGRERRLFWPAQLCTILSSELENRSIRRTLRAILKNGNGWYNQKNPRVRQRMALEQIYKKQLKGHTSLAMLKVQNLFDRALLEKSLGNKLNYIALRKQAKTLLTTYLKQKSFRKLKKYIPYLMHSEKDEVKKQIAQANSFMAKILLREADGQKTPAAIKAKLTQVLPYLLKARALDGLAYLEVRQMYSEYLTRMGYILKGEKKSYLPQIINAKKELNAILAWAATYRAAISNVPKWLLSIQTSSEISKADLIMAVEANASKPLNIQLKLLRQAAGTYHKALGKPLKRIVKYELRTNVLISLAENRARRAFILKEQGKPYKSLLAKAKAFFVKPKRKLSAKKKIIVMLWMAKILFIQAGSADRSQKRKNILARAEKHIKAVLAAKDLRGYLLISAKQTYGEILLLQRKLNAAKAVFIEAIKLDPANYDCRVNLADIYNQQANYAKARKHYAIVKNKGKTSSLVRRAKLGIAEANMREGEKYSIPHIKAFQDIAFEIIRSEPIGSFLIRRAIQGLIEAYSTDEKLQPRIVFIGKTLLGTNHQKNRAPTQLKEAIQSLLTPARKISLSNRFKALLYLKLAEATSWEKDFDRANTTLSTIPTKVMELINNDIKLKAQFDLLRAELKLRDKKDIEAFIKGPLEQAVFKTDDPDLITRFIFDKLEAHLVKKKYKKAVKLAELYLTKAKRDEIKEKFKGRDYSFMKYRYTLRLKLANALHWDKDSRAEKALDNLLRDIRPATPLGKSFPTLAALFRAKIHISRAEVYISKKPPKFEAALKAYPIAKNILLKIDSRKTIFPLAQAYFGLAELRRYAKGIINFKASRNLYLIARKYAERTHKANPERGKLLDKIADGLYELKIASGDYHSVTASTEFFCGGNRACETQLTLGGELSFGIFSKNWSWLHATLAIQGDLAEIDGEKLSVGSVYLGLKGTHISPTRWSLNYGFQVKVGPSFQYYKDPKEATTFFKQPELKLNLFFWSRWASVGLAANLELENQKYLEEQSTYYFALMANFDWVTDLVSEKYARWIKGLSLGAEYNRYYYAYDNALKNTHSIGLGGNYKVKLHKRVEAQLRLMQLIYFSDNQWKYGVEFGLGASVNITKRLLLKATFTHQATEFPINRFWLNAEYRF